MGEVLESIERVWGYSTLRPLQAEAIEAGLSNRDSLVVMPTGGGKSLCYQVPPLVAGRTDIVVSPLISLMKDQVDGLLANGYPCAALNSSLIPADQRQVLEDFAGGAYRLLFIAPERLGQSAIERAAKQAGVRAIAIDEAHCISHWGHDFRPEYRQLHDLRNRLPGVSMHAFTATATPRVQADIVRQLGLRDPATLIGSYDRPNLTYRILRRTSLKAQVLQILKRHEGEAAIVYCISRKDTESLAESLSKEGIHAAAYHAGMSSEQRRRTQEAFASERLDVVVATVAFGMGIDRSDVRCVIHAAMPKSIEHYQQEVGRAGRDGLAAECVLLFSPADVLRWKRLMERSASESDDPQAAAVDVSMQAELLSHMASLAAGAKCRHRAVVEYFGQTLEGESCGACDVCLGEVNLMPDALEVAQKIVSCVARLDRNKQSFGVVHLSHILHGSDNDSIRKFRHDQLSTHGILAEFRREDIVTLIHQVIELGFLSRSESERPVVVINERSRSVLTGTASVALIEPGPKVVKKSKVEQADWEGVDRTLFETLKTLRRQLASERGVPAFVVFGDATLRDMARQRPRSPEALRSIKGVGEVKIETFGEAFLEAIKQHEASTA